MIAIDDSREKPHTGANGPLGFFTRLTAVTRQLQAYFSLLSMTLATVSLMPL